MNLVTIPKKVAGGKDDLVVIPRAEYESLKERAEAVPEYTPTKAEVRALRAAEKRFEQGAFYTLKDVKQDLERRRRRQHKKNA